jgi:hypothetical protein
MLRVGDMDQAAQWIIKGVGKPPGADMMIGHFKLTLVLIYNVTSSGSSGEVTTLHS